MGSNALVGVVSLLFLLLLSCSKGEESRPPTKELKSFHEPGPTIVRPASGPSGIPNLPDDVRKPLLDATAKISDRVDPLMHRKDAVIAIADPTERREQIDAMRDAVGALASELEELLDDSTKPWAPYRRDPAYSHCFQQFQNRFDFYTRELADLKRRSAAALEESKSQIASKH